jgi:hypothetical protein
MERLFLRGFATKLIDSFAVFCVSHHTFPLLGVVTVR